MKFPTPYGVAIFKGNQEKARKCYVEVMNKMCNRALQPATVSTIFKIDEIDPPNGKIKPFSDLDTSYPKRRSEHSQ
ncbi:hypothetical protein TIFTF001_014298 [Ficus carica]|uniref:Uncharacterized protein n=1 Tax=Ficus carica TaxID=3494 RepID=A0AA88D5H4_FICCA|nr:hypothetical protein TIFTF001_014298 [Ficus carica]